MMLPRIDKLEGAHADAVEQISSCKQDILQLQDDLLDTRNIKFDKIDFERFQQTLKLRLD